MPTVKRLKAIPHECRFSSSTLAGTRHDEGSGTYNWRFSRVKTSDQSMSPCWHAAIIAPHPRLVENRLLCLEGMRANEVRWDFSIHG